MVAPWPRISTTFLSPRLVRERPAQLRGPDQHVGVAPGLADFEDRDAAAQEAAHVEHRPQPRALGRAKGNQRVGVAMHHRHHVGAQLVDLAVDEALGILRLVRMGQRREVHVEQHDVLRRHHARRQMACHQVVVRIVRVPHADVPEGVDRLEAEQDLVGEHEVGEQFLGRGEFLGSFLAAFIKAVLP